MVYQIKYDDIMSVGAFTNSTSKAYSDQLEAISKSISPIISMNQLKGQAADSVKTYLAEVHGNILGSIGQIIQEYQVRFLLYKDGYFQEIDNDLHAQLDEKVFDELVSFFKSSKNAFELEQVNLESTIGTINDILATKISGQNVLQSYDDASKKVNDLRTKTGEYETKHKNADLVNFKNMLQALKLLIADYQGRNSNVVTQYEAGGIATANGAQDLSAALQASAAGMQASQSQIEAAGSREEERWKAFEKELADARKEKGMWNAVFAVGAIVIGGAAIVLTAGAATPLVVTAAVAGTASMAYGASNLVEAGQDIYYGANGDGFSMAINPLRDTIFMGNQQAYDIFGLAATTVAGLCIPVGTGLKAAETAAKTAGTTVTRQLVTQAVAKELGKEAITGAVAGGTGYATNWAANEFLPQFVGKDAARNIGIGGSLLTGLAAGWGTYKGLSNMSVFQVKAAPNSGIQPKPAISPEGIQGVTLKEGSFETSRSSQTTPKNAGSAVEIGGGVSRFDVGEETVTYRRVQGGQGDKSSQDRIVIDGDGNIFINKKNRDLNISIDNGEHATHFIENNRPGADLIEIEMPKWFDDFVQENMIPQAGSKANPANQGGAAPKLTDPTTPGVSVEFPPPWSEWIEEHAINFKVIKGGK